MRWQKSIRLILLSLSIYWVNAQERSDVGLPDDGEDNVFEPSSKPNSEQSATEVKIDGRNFSFPIVLPPSNITQLTPAELGQRCLLYLEGLNIFVWNKPNSQFRHAVIGSKGYDTTDYNATFSYSDVFVDCSAVLNYTVGSARFLIAVDPAGSVFNDESEGSAGLFVIPKQRIELQLTFTRDERGYWSLTAIKTLRDLEINAGSDTSFLSKTITLPTGSVINDKSTMDILGVQSWNGYGYACSQTPAAFAHIDDTYSIGIGFINLQVDLDAGANDQMLYFRHDVSDCIGTFSVGSWMGIVCSFVLVSVLMFGYLMLQSVQTMDRFDDPKQKQIVINFKE